MDTKEYQPLRIVLGIRVVTLLLLAYVALILTFTCFGERSSASVEKETASFTDSTYLSSVDTMNTEMRMEIERASVSFVVYNDDTYTPARIDLVYEDNRWVIDDFHNLRYMIDLRNCMWDYLTHDIV